MNSDAVRHLALVAGAGITAAVLAWASAKWRRRRRLLALTAAVTRRHARQLSVKRQQFVAYDGYGNTDLRLWIEHVAYFLRSVVLREARTAGFRVDGIAPGCAIWSGMTRTLLATLKAEGDAAPAEIEDRDILSGRHYEALCRKILQGAGWRVETTPASGDQGADLIAEARGCRVILQCKFHARPVGNKAVQEAHAALRFHAGHRAAAVSNAGFTRSARQLARATGVLLLHHNELPDLGRKLADPDP